MKVSSTSFLQVHIVPELSRYCGKNGRGQIMTMLLNGPSQYTLAHS